MMGWPKKLNLAAHEAGKTNLFDLGMLGRREPGRVTVGKQSSSFDLGQLRDQGGVRAKDRLEVIFADLDQRHWRGRYDSGAARRPGEQRHLAEYLSWVQPTD